ncbi:hypothetical protein WP8S17C03_16250 [Metapseudomonas otitidis]|uniref:diguanylate cyclase n=1 Tax=Metapseudomonas otitidis TaxID=319939 RepID=A0A6S5RU08_9GAMM|nr:GGDEF domain-containing protein [Pseudomonas otitidis]MDV3438604.1 GGDEF domain-containing protein [Pseudomonas otitidis]BBT15576.1 hypothetical protein WP8S17C03_16250 [Pseudomonas otitidis]
MHIKTLKKIEDEIKNLPEVKELKTSEPNKKTLIHRDKLRQQRFLDGKQDRLSTTRIFLEHDEYIFTVELNKKIYSSKFATLKNKLDNIISQHENAFNARHDKLTEIYNRNGFEAEINKLRAERHITLCIADIDNFKQINDSYSHDFGDKVLQEFANNLKRICQSITGKKIIFSRYGGEEFVIAIISETPDTETPEVIRKETRGTLEHVEFKASLGFSSTELQQKPSKETIGLLYKQADAALYKSKREGKDRSTNFKDIRHYLGKIIEIDERYKVITIDIGKNTGTQLTDNFYIFPAKYSGREKFIIDDGRSKKPIGTYPKIKIGRIKPFEVQEEISFCQLISGDYKKIEIGARLELCSEDEEFNDTFNELTQDE